ncbi:hypothetical protein ABAC460_10295 [Asticcacaulis sp. AC460]|uniref:hypothetical protein n=1 Tax=Asticcacaulis sp. AC460 TaxID=1282360 RepID=UPI0003C3F92D|nr:hypothetical protein [Asticcacaulis sp. AC460]ESQ90131.1 hypothetical protein ABAC460_10295 [Asticcacaulis sp. AC460]
MEVKTQYLDATDLRDVNNKINGLMAVVASLPGVGDINPASARAYLKGAILDSDNDKIGNDQLARSMYFAQAIIQMAREGQPKVD